jgi:hypothetical protein
LERISDQWSITLKDPDRLDDEILVSHLIDIEKLRNNDLNNFMLARIERLTEEIDWTKGKPLSKESNNLLGNEDLMKDSDETEQSTLESLH